MKKIFATIAIALATLMATSCDTEFGLVYNVDIIGDADGNVELTFPDGSLALNGTTDLNFHYGKTQILKGKFVALNAEDVADQFSATSASGTYYVHIIGYVQEKGTSAKFSIDKVLTNREN